MIIELEQTLLEEIQRHGEQAYPEEGAGLLLGRSGGGSRRAVQILPRTNSREEQARHNRYLISPQDILQAEIIAESRGMDVIGVFHSHPDHPAEPSEFDREWAMPWFSYMITSVAGGRAQDSRSWRLSDDRSRFDEEEIRVKVPSQ
ncbi:MAG: M67 family metallopeptidase [Anaerolineales bacterium]|nr:M67 family metallopeptidase [Anaerolineales bacterium]